MGPRCRYAQHGIPYRRGFLLHGPPGTGKTHTTRYVVQRLAGSTVILLSGQALRMIGAVTGLARELQPAVVVLEDVDLAYVCGSARFASYAEELLMACGLDPGAIRVERFGPTGD